jgi:uncharacterized protein YacL
MSLHLEQLDPAEAAERRKAIMLRVVRAGFLILMVTFALLAALQQQQSDRKVFSPESSWWMPVGIALVVAMLLFGAAIAIDLATPRKKISMITGVMFGIIAGVLATAALGFVIDLLLESWVQNTQALDVLRPIVISFKVLIGLTLCYIGVTTVLQTQDDFRLVVPYVEFAKQIRGVRPMLIDTTVLIDGRLVDVAATGFLQAPIVIPRFVINELQTLADSQDPMKRAKGRRGLEFTARMQRTARLDVTIDETPTPGKAVDQMLLDRARSMPAILVTGDVALAQVAKIENIATLNVNDLANAMKSSLVPGEPINVRLMRPGEQPGQAVGYLPDGTMVVAENGAGRIGQTVDMTVSSSLQTSAGRLVFARISDGADAVPAESTHVEPAASGPAGAAAEGTAPESAPPIDVAAPAKQPRSPFPPAQTFRPTRPGTPRNPRR